LRPEEGKGNIITIPNFDDMGTKQEELPKNMVRIDEFVIIENEGGDDDVRKVSSDSLANNPLKKNDVTKINNIIYNVEQLNYKTNYNKNTIRKCIVCEKDNLMVTELLKFKTVEDVIIYLKHVFDNQDKVYKINDIVFEGNRDALVKITKNVNKFLRNSLKTAKYLCKNCLFSKLNHENGISMLCKLFEFNSIMTQQVENEVATDHNMSNSKSFTPKSPMKTESNENINLKENLENIGNIENTINMILNSDSNNPGALQKMIEGITSPGNFNNLSQNFSKMVEAITNFNNKNLSHNNNVVSSVNSLMGVLQNAAAEQIAKNENDTFKDMTGENRDNKDGNFF
jgi:hypothetical protein